MEGGDVIGDSVERSETYAWARRHGLHDPYDFAITYEDTWGAKEELAECARRWERKHLMDRKQRIEEEMKELRRKAETIENGLERIETYVYD
jgi:hypothetical protein